MSKQQITETDRDNLCDILWWLKGYKKGANDNLEMCEFNEGHMTSLDKVVRHLRDVLSPPTKTDSPEIKSPFGMDVSEDCKKYIYDNAKNLNDVQEVERLSHEYLKYRGADGELKDLPLGEPGKFFDGRPDVLPEFMLIKIRIIREGDEIKLYSNVSGKYFDVKEKKSEIGISLKRIN